MQEDTRMYSQIQEELIIKIARCLAIPSSVLAEKTKLSSIGELDQMFRQVSAGELVYDKGEFKEVPMREFTSADFKNIGKQLNAIASRRNSKG